MVNLVWGTEAFCKLRSILTLGDSRYAARMEELKEKFEDNPKMRAKYELYKRKSTALINLI